MKKSLANLESEKIVLGAMVMNPERIESVIPLVTPEDFYYPKNCSIFRELLTMSLSKVPIDLVSLTVRLGDEVPSSYISSLLDGLHKNANIDAALQKIRELSQLRKVVGQAQAVIDTAELGNYGGTLDTIAKMDIIGVKEKVHKSTAEKVREWVTITSGYFSITGCFRALQTITKQEEGAIRVALHRMAKSGEVAKHPSKEGLYRKVEQESEILDWINANEDEYPIVLPLGLSERIQIMPRSIIVIAGTPNVGKSAFCLELIRLNMDKLKINYFTSELGPTKLRMRLKLFEDVPFPDGWKFNAFFRTANYGDAIHGLGNDLNVIDYIEVATDVFQMGDLIKAIFERLDKGVAAIAIQKKFGAEMGRGAEFSLEKPSLYLSVEKGTVKILKAKEWRGMVNPNGQIMTFSLHHGAKFDITSELHDPECDKIAKQAKRYGG